MKIRLNCSWINNKTLLHHAGHLIFGYNSKLLSYIYIIKVVNKIKVKINIIYQVNQCDIIKIVSKFACYACNLYMYIVRKFKIVK